MDTTAVVIAFVWVVVGYFFARWFVNHFLDNHRWADTGEVPGAFSLLMLTFFGPIMGALMGGTALLGWVFGGGFSNLIRRFYGVPTVGEQ